MALFESSSSQTGLATVGPCKENDEAAHRFLWLLSASERAAWVLTIVAETVPYFQCRFPQQEIAGALCTAEGACWHP
jgi:hypothetical protein